MSQILYKRNTRFILIMISCMYSLSIIIHALNRWVGIDIRIEFGLYGLAVYGPLILYYNKNTLWKRIAENPLALAYCIYIAISFLYGLWRFGTPSVAFSDLFLFSFLPAFMLIPVNSFDVRSMDRLIAAGVIIGSIGIALVPLIFPVAMYDREVFHKFGTVFLFMATGSVYLLLKYTVSLNWLTFVGLFGVCSIGLFYGIVGAFRGQLLLSLIVLILFFYLQLRSRKVALGFKVLSLAVVSAFVLSIIILAATRFEEQFHYVTERFTGIFESYLVTGDVYASDGRLKEARYFRELNPDYKLVLGHGVGGYWYDFFGMYRTQTEFGETGQQVRRGVVGTRSMLHINWLHVVFKIGALGLFLLIVMIGTHFKRFGLLKNNPAWWAFFIYYFAWTSYYGDKELNARSLILLAVLVAPWIFRSGVEFKVKPIIKQARS